MPLNLPDKLPAIELLKEENIFVIDNSRANAQDIRPLKIVILNLMPLKITTETDLVRLLSNTPLQLEISFMKLKSHTSKNTPVEHMKAFYRDFDLMRNETYDGMIVTGAPVEQMPYEEVTYWNEITTILTGRVLMSLPHFIFAGQHKPDFITSMECLSIRWIKRCSAFLNTISMCRDCLSSVGSMMCFCASQPSHRSASGRYPEGKRPHLAVRVG